MNQSPGEKLVDLDVGMAHHHEVDLHIFNNLHRYQHGQESKNKVVLVLPHAIVHLDVEVLDPHHVPIHGVAFAKQPREDTMDCGAHQVAPCHAKNQSQHLSGSTIIHCS